MGEANPRMCSIWLQQTSHTGSRISAPKSASSMSTQLAQRVDPDAKAAPKPADVKDVKPVKASKPRIDCSWSELRV